MKPLSGRIERERDKKRRVDDVRGPGPEKSLSPCRPLSPPIRLLAGAGILPVLPVLPVLLPALSRERAKQQEATFHYFLGPSQCQRAGNGHDSVSGEGGVGRV